MTDDPRPIRYGLLVGIVGGLVVAVLGYPIALLWQHLSPPPEAAASVTPTTTRPGQSATTLATSPVVPSRAPTCEDHGGLVAVTPVQVEGAYLTDPAALGGLAHTPDRLIDGLVGTDWSEGAPGLGHGSSVTFTFARTVDLRLMCMVNGYGYSWNLYEANGRVNEAMITSAAGTAQVTLKDLGSPAQPAVFQTVVPPAGDTDSVTFTIQNAYPPKAIDGGTGYEDTGVSEVQFWAQP